MAYYLGKIATSDRKDLDAIRNIRNEFAHHAEVLDFDNQSIRDRCSNLHHNWREKDESTRSKFCSAVTSILVRIEIEQMNATAAVEAVERNHPERIREHVLLYRASLDELTKAPPGLG